MGPLCGHNCVTPSDMGPLCGHNCVTPSDMGPLCGHNCVTPSDMGPLCGHNCVTPSDMGPLCGHNCVTPSDMGPLCGHNCMTSSDLGPLCGHNCVTFSDMGPLWSWLSDLQWHKPIVWSNCVTSSDTDPLWPGGLGGMFSLFIVNEGRSFLAHSGLILGLCPANERRGYFSLVWMSLDFTGEQSTLVEVMAWWRQATCHYLSHSWQRYLSPYGIKRPQWVNINFAPVCAFHVSSWIMANISESSLLVYQ